MRTEDRETANRRLGPEFSDPKPHAELPHPALPEPVPLTEAEIIRLRVLRAMPAPTAAEAEEMRGLAASEHVVLPEPAPLTEDEAKRLADLSEPRTLTEAEGAEVAALSARASIPRPAPELSPEERAARVALGFPELVGLVAALADQVPGAHGIAAQLRRLRTSLG